jgi:uncharacterized protein
VPSALIDAGPLVALFEPDDRHHERYDALVATLIDEGLQLITTWPCIVEASYLLHAPQRFDLLRWVERGGVSVYPFDARQLGPMIEWMQRYTERGKRAMDLADATLYWLATETGITDILTVDIADFRRYRLPNGRSFRVL